MGMQPAVELIAKVLLQLHQLFLLLSGLFCTSGLDLTIMGWNNRHFCHALLLAGLQGILTMLMSRVKRMMSQP